MSTSDIPRLYNVWWQDNEEYQLNREHEETLICTEKEARAIEVAFRVKHPEAEVTEWWPEDRRALSASAFRSRYHLKDD